MRQRGWRTKKSIKEHKHYTHHHHMSAKEKRAFKKRMDTSKNLKRRERWNAYGSHTTIDRTFSPSLLTRQHKVRHI